MEMGGTSDTNASGQQAFLVVGDSIARGTNNTPTDGPGPTPTAGTSYYFRRSNTTVIEIGANDLQFAPEPPNDGSPWPQFAIDYNAATGKKAVIVPTGIASTTYALKTDAAHCWNPDEVGSLYSSIAPDVANTLSILGVSKLKAIFVILGINDSRGTVPLATETAVIGRFYEQLQIDYPGVPIVIFQCGCDLDGPITQRLGSIRKDLKNVAIANTNIHLMGGILSAYGNNETVGDVHLNQTGNNNLGSMASRWVVNSAYTKWARSIISSYYTDITLAQKTLISNFIATYQSTYLNHDALLIFNTDNNKSIFHDWAFMNCSKNFGATFTTDVGLSGNGSSFYFASGYSPLYTLGKATLNDIYIAAKTGTIISVAGTIVSLFGSLVSATTALRITTNTGPNRLTALANDFASLGYNTDTAFASNTEYAIRRSASNARAIVKNGVSVANDAGASISQPQFQLFILANANNGSTANQFLDGVVQFFRVAKNNSVDNSSFLTALETLIAAW